MNDKKSSGFGGIFKKLGELAIKPEYLQQEENQPEEQVVTQAVQTPVQQSQSTKTVFATANTTSFAAMTTAILTPDEIKETVEKIYNYLESINKPGIDFLEFWNGVEAMEGGATVQNIKNAFAAVKMMSGNTVSKEMLISTGNQYVEDITKAINADIQKKEKIKEQLNTELSNEKNKLEGEVLSLQTQLETLQKQLGTKQTELMKISEKYAPKMQEAEKDVIRGNSALKLVLTEMNQFISLIGTSIQ